MRRATIALAALGLAGCVAPAARRPAVSAPPSPGPAPAAEALVTDRSVAELIAGAPNLSRFRALAGAGGLDRLIAGRGGVTVLAPDDAAFARLPPETVEALLRPGNRPSLLHLLRYWIVPGRVSPDDLAARIAAGGAVRLPTLDAETIAAPGATMLVDAAGRRGYLVRETAASDGTLIELNGIIAPRSIEPGRPPATGR